MVEQRSMRGMWIRRGVGIAAMGVLAAALLGWVVMSLWNCLIPPIFGLKAVHYWQAVGLLVLSRILVGGFHRGHGHGFRRRQHIIQRWESMSPEEREKFKRGFRGRFCGCGETDKG
jgi:hypothetical protein